MKTNKKRLLFALILAFILMMAFTGCELVNLAEGTDTPSGNESSGDVSKTITENFTIEIVAETQFCDSSLYGYDSSGQRVLFVYESPEFDGDFDFVFSMNDIHNFIRGHKYMDHGLWPEQYQRTKDTYLYSDYLRELAPNEQDSLWFDITTCAVTYNKNNIVSIRQKNDWYMGGVHDQSFRGHIYDVTTGKGLLITDIMHGTKQEIYNLLQREFAAQYGQLLSPTDDDSIHQYFLTEEGLQYAPGNIHGFQRGSLLTIPYSRTDLFKKPFAQ
jgi:hypothetical protein